jgi:hypothetical protein
VREYIHCKSILAGIEESMAKDFSSEEFLGHYNDKKNQFESVGLSAPCGGNTCF